MQSFERIKKIEPFTKKITIGICIVIIIGLLVTSIVKFFDTNILDSFQPTHSKTVAIYNEFLIQADELNRRIISCDAQIDSMSPSYSDAASFHCEMMLLQIKKFTMFIGVTKTKDPKYTLLVERGLRTIIRYTEYRQAINQRLRKTPSDLTT